MAKNRRYMMDEDFDEKDRIDDNDIDDYYVQEAPVKRSRKSNKNITRIQSHTIPKK